MPVHNSDIVDILNRVAELLEMEDANPFRVRAYRNAARTIETQSRSIADMVTGKEPLHQLPGIGKDLAGKIEEITRTGTLSQLEELQKKTPAELHEVLKIPSLGPKKARALYRELDISNLDELEQAAENRKIRGLPGFGEKTEQRILQEIRRRSAEEDRVKLKVAEEIAATLTGYLKRVKGVKKTTPAGSFRRKKETVGDLDILATCQRGSQIMDRFVAYEDVERVVSQGKTRSTVILKSGLHVDLRVVPQVSYGAALHYFTGSKAHNIAIRKMALKKKLKINEYGVYRAGERIAGKTEKEVYGQVGLPYIEPELREDRGEIEAAQKNSLPKLITAADIRGDLHCHTRATDGHNSLKEMVSAAGERGYDYLAITNHSKHVSVTRGLDPKRLARQIEEIDRLNEKLEGIGVLKSIEVDILEDGSLDLPDSILRELDFTVCSIHSKFDLSKSRQTERILRAMDNPYFNILGHPTGRLIGRRRPYRLDIKQIMAAAKERGCFMELSAQPDRLDLDDVHCKMAREMGVKVAISTDAHRIEDLDWMRFGLGQARRGWLEPEDILNTRSRRELMRLMNRS